MDLKQYEPGIARLDDGIPVYIKGPSGEETDLVIHVASYESERVKKALRAMGEAELKRQQRRQTKTVSVEVIEERALTMAVACVLSWENMLENGEPLECNAENVRYILNKYRFITEQVDTAAGDRALFFEN